MIKFDSFLSNFFSEKKVLLLLRRNLPFFFPQCYFCGNNLLEILLSNFHHVTPIEHAKFYAILVSRYLYFMPDLKNHRYYTCHFFPTVSKNNNYWDEKNKNISFPEEECKISGFRY